MKIRNATTAEVARELRSTYPQFKVETSRVDRTETVISMYDPWDEPAYAPIFSITRYHYGPGDDEWALHVSECNSTHGYNLDGFRTARTLALELEKVAGPLHRNYLARGRTPNK
jgi:hypothetical protein